MIHDKRDLHDLFFWLLILLFLFLIFWTIGELAIISIEFAEIRLTIGRPDIIGSIIVTVTAIPFSKNIILIILLYSWNGAI